jgi:hypothetical protein
MENIMKSKIIQGPIAVLPDPNSSFIYMVSSADMATCIQQIDPVAGKITNYSPFFLQTVYFAMLV